MKKMYARKGFLWFTMKGKVSRLNRAAMCPAVLKPLGAALAAALLICLSSQPAFAAITEGDVQAQVDSAGKEAVAGNVLIWFLCAVSFLKISQKIDSFMASLGVNVGHTGGSMLAAAMIATKGLSTVRNASSNHFGGGRGSSPGKGASPGTAGAMGGFMSGGLAGVVSRSIQNGAARAATGSSDAGAAGGIGGAGKNAGVTGGASGGVGGQIFASSVSKGGNFANNVISSIATGNIATSGSMTEERAAQALQSYMGYAALGDGAEHVSSFSDVEIGGGRITGTEVSEDYPEGASFGMYHTAQYTAPSGSYTTVQTADGASWYKQYAADTVEKSPYMAPDGSIAYNEAIVKKLAPPPQRKDRL